MNIGRLDRRIKISKIVNLVSAGDPGEYWGAVDGKASSGLLMWATKLDKVGTHADELGKDVGIRKTEFTIRWRAFDVSDVTDIMDVDTYVIQYDSKDYKVQSVEEIGRRVGLRFHTIRRD
tara:strand:+ start:2251 stop:2610 length:360 start_codon:yes stop_codon:yes gene_type:complete